MKPWPYLAALALALSPLAVLRPVFIEGHSMEPTLAAGSFVVARRAWTCAAPALGEVWLVQGPEGPVVKRLVALPGDTLVAQGGFLRRNGVPLPETDPPLGDLAEGSWQAGSGYLLLGDHRAVSRDSRHWGPVPRTAFIARLSRP